MPNAPQPALENARRLLKALWRFRDRLAGAQATGLPFLSRRRRKDALLRDFATDWPGGYVLHRSGDAVFVPTPIDERGRHNLFNVPGAHPTPLRFLPPGAIAIDVGANLGEWALPMAKAVGPSGRLYAFEPVTATADALSKTLRINNQPHARVVRRAVSDRSGSVEFVVEREDSGRSRIGKANAGEHAVSVEMTTLDSFVEAEGLPSLALIKIDVEGHEAAALRGAAHTIERFRPILVVEIGHESPEDRQAIHGMLTGFGYDLVGILLDHGVAEGDWTSYRAAAAPFTPGAVHNILLLPQPRP